MTPQPQTTVFSKNLFFFWRLFWAQSQEGHCWTPSKTPSSRKSSHSAIRTERADRVDLPVVGWKCGPEHAGRAPFDAKTRKGKVARTRSKETARARTPRMRKDSEMMGIADTGNGGTDKRFVCWSRQVCRVETDTEELQDVDPKSKQTPVPVAALRRISNTDLPDDLRNDARIRTIPSQSAYHVQQEYEDRTSFEDNDAVEHESSPQCGSGMPTRSASRVV